MKLHEKIYTLRTEKKLSQGDLAEILDVSRQSVSKWETGASVPDLDKLIKMSDLFGVSIDYLVREEMTENEQKTAENDQKTEEKGENSQNVVSIEESKSAPRSVIGNHIVYYGGCLVFLIANYLFPHYFGIEISDVWFRIPMIFMVGFIPMLIWTLYEFRAFRFSPNLKQKMLCVAAWAFYLIFPIVMELLIAFVWNGAIYLRYGGGVFYIWKAVSPFILGVLVVFTAAWIRTHREKKKEGSAL